MAAKDTEKTLLLRVEGCFYVIRLYIKDSDRCNRAEDEPQEIL